MSAFFTRLRDAVRTSIAPRRIAALLVIAAAGTGLVVFARGSTPWGAPWGEASGAPSSLDAADDGERLDRALERVVDQSGIDRASIRGRFVPIVTEGDSFSRAELDLPVPRSASFAQLNVGISRAAGQAGASIFDVIELGPRPGRPTGLEIRLGVGERATHLLRLEREPAPEAPAAKGRDATPGPRRPRIALVIDDLGFTLDGLARELVAIDAPLTFGVIAGLKHSVAFAESARAHGHDVILHVPMEPIDREEHDPGRNAILSGADATENLRRLRANMNGLSEYSGVSNHMGSRVTADGPLMALVLEEMRGRDRSLYFLDSRTTPFSVVPREGRRAGVRVLVNNLFLDGDAPSEVDPRAQTLRLEEIARRRGTSIGIGHVGEDTVAAIQEAVARWRENDIELVTLSQLAGKERETTSRKRPTS